MKNLTITGGTTTESGSALYYYGGVLTLEEVPLILKTKLQNFIYKMKITQ